MNRSKKLALTLVACMLAAPAFADEVAEHYGHGFEKRQATLEKVKLRTHEHAAAMERITADFERCVDGATSMEAVKACHMRAHEARKAYAMEQKAAFDGHRGDRGAERHAGDGPRVEHRDHFHPGMTMHRQDLPANTPQAVPPQK